MENQRKYKFLNKEAGETIKNVCENGISISAITQICDVLRTNVWEGYRSENRVQNKTRWTQTEDLKAVRWFDNHYYQQNYNWPIMTIKKGIFPQHGRWLIRNRMSESVLKLQSLIKTPTITAKQRRKRYKFPLDMRECPVCYWWSGFFTDETIITKNFLNSKQKVICGARFPESVSPLMRRGAHPSKKLCWFALRYEEPMRWE